MNKIKLKIVASNDDTKVHIQIQVKDKRDTTSDFIAVGTLVDNTGDDCNDNTIYFTRENAETIVAGKIHDVLSQMAILTVQDLNVNEFLGSEENFFYFQIKKGN